MDNKFNHVNDFFYTEEYENDKEPNIMPEKEIKFTAKEFNLFIVKINELYKKINSIELPNNFKETRTFRIDTEVTRCLHSVKSGIGELTAMTLLKVKQQ